MNEVEFYIEDLKTKFAKIDTTKYYLCYSGGRDSHFVYWFIKNILKDDKIKIVSINTLMEHKEIRKRMINEANLVLLPLQKHKDIKEKYGSPCFTKQQDEYIDRYQRGSRATSTINFILGLNTKSKFNLSKKARDLLLSGKLHKVSNKCCNALKKEPLKKFEKETGLKPIVCIRSSEGIMRNKIKNCFNKNGMFTPIHDLSDELLKNIEEHYNIEVPEVYNFVSRTGCMGCPYGRNTETELKLISDAQKRFVVDYFKESYDVKGIKYESKNGKGSRFPSALIGRGLKPSENIKGTLLYISNTRKNKGFQVSKTNVLNKKLNEEENEQ